MTWHRLVSDNDGHEYVIPADKTEKWWAYIEAIDKYWSPFSSHEGDPPEEPEWAHEIGGVLLFREWTHG